MEKTESTYRDCSYYKAVYDHNGWCTLNEAYCDAELGEDCPELDELREQDEIEYTQKNVGG